MLLTITGATKGIGLAIVEAFAQEGFKVAFCARKPDGVDALVARFGADKIFFKAVDMSQPAEVDAFGQWVIDTVGVPDVLVNNAGVFLPGSVLDEDEGSHELQWATNVQSAYRLTRILGRPMRERRSGHIFNICSTASITAYPNGGSYCMTKYALLGMSKVLREELKPHQVRVTAVMPGATLTNSWAGVDLPEERFMPAADVAALIWQVYKLSDRTVVEELVLRPQLGDLG